MKYETDPSIHFQSGVAFASKRGQFTVYTFHALFILIYAIG